MDSLASARQFLEVSSGYLDRSVRDSRGFDWGSRTSMSSSPMDSLMVWMVGALLCVSQDRGAALLVT